MKSPSVSVSVFAATITLCLLPLPVPSKTMPRDADRPPSVVHIYANQSPAQVERTYFCALTSDVSAIVEFRRQLVRSGARNVILFMPDGVLVCDMPVGAPPPALSREFIRLAPGETAPRRFQRALRTFAEAERIAGRADVEAVSPEGAVLPPDAMTVLSPERVREIQTAVAQHLSVTQDCEVRNVQQNSEILGGEILIQVITPESQSFGLPDSWGSELFIVHSGLAAMVMDLQTQFSNVPISVTFKFYEKVPTRFEPNYFAQQESHRWLKDVMSRVRNCPTDWRVEECVHALNTENRCIYDTDWVFTAFIIDAGSVGSQFAQGDYRSFGFLGGPYFVLSLPAAYPAGLDVYTQFTNYAERLTLMMFWAMMEEVYRDGPDCKDRSGYLNWENGNITYLGGGEFRRCNPYVACIMHLSVESAPARICEWTRGHIGLIDFDENNIPDAFDTKPRIVFAVEAPETTDTDAFAIQWRGISDAIPNQNPLQSESERRDYAAALVEGDAVLASLGRQFPLNSLPVDGEWNESREDVSTLVPLFKGYNEVSVRVINSVGAKSEVRVKQVYRAGINYQHFEVQPDFVGNILTWSTRGVRFGAVFDVYRWVGKGTREHIGVVANPYTKEDGFDHFKFVDRTVNRGVRYTYNVVASFDATIAGEPKHFEEPTPAASGVARVWLPEGAIARAGPNPFRERVAVTVAVPEKPLGTSQDPNNDFGTPVAIDVFDVTGRLVARVHRANETTGLKTVSWDGLNHRGRSVSPGIYFVRVRVGNHHDVQKILRVR